MNRSSMPVNTTKLKKWWEDPNKILRCDLPFQRHAGAWSSIIKSTFIWSLLSDCYVHPILLLKDKLGVDAKGKTTFTYNIEDGQQRLTSLFAYLNDEWACHSATPTVEMDGFTYDLAGLKFSELPEELQNTLKQFTFSGQCFENYTMEEAENLFYIINSGVPLSAIQKSKSRMGTELIKFFSRLLDGHFFTQAINITEAQARREDDLLMLLQAALLLDNRHENLDYKSISAANCLAYAESIRGNYNSDKQQMLAEVVQYLDEAFPAKNKFLRKNNVPIVIVLAKVALEQGVEAKTFGGFVSIFANGIYPAYEEASGSGNVKAKLVQMRLRVMFLAFCQHFDLDCDEVQKPFADNISLSVSEAENKEVPVIETGDVEIIPPSDESGVESEDDSERSTEDETDGVESETESEESAEGETNGLEPEIESEEPIEDENSEADEDVASSDGAEEEFEEISEEDSEKSENVDESEVQGVVADGEE